jgi:hypothetical protein
MPEEQEQVKKEPVVVWKYTHPEKFLLGIPARDLTDQDLEQMDGDLVAAVRASGLYEEVPQKGRK